MTFHRRHAFKQVMEQERLQIEAAQQDPAGFARLYEDNFERVYVFVVRRVGGRDQAEDLTAETFQHALANLDRFEWRGVPFVVWLYRIAANLIADRGRRLSREAVDSNSDELDQSEWPEIERRATLYQLVDSLAEDQRQVIIKRFVEQKSIREIAEEFGRTEGAVKQLQLRAMEKLRERAGGHHE